MVIFAAPAFQPGWLSLPEFVNMSSHSDIITGLFQQSHSGVAVQSIDKIPQSGSDRNYYRIHAADGRSVIATVSSHIQENETFLYFSSHFRSKGCPVPEILAVSADRSAYLQRDAGNDSLLNILEREGHNNHVYTLFQKSLQALAHIQIKGDEALDYSRCITSREFGKQAIISDLLYFKYYFLDTLKIPYDKEKLLEDFDALSMYLSHVDYKYFLFRDFQSRNVLVDQDEVTFIDYQGGMKGALQYDVASLLWQAKAELPDDWKNNLLHYYIDCVETLLNTKIDRNRFTGQYHGYVLIRLLQVLGAYGFRGLFERKAHFLTSIPIALRNLKWFLGNKQVGISLPEFERLLQLVTSDEIISRFTVPRATTSTPLLIQVNSFSYLKNGYPADSSKNGGGFVFDCRGILNPGRIEQYKKLTGKDKPVQDYLEQQTRMPDFLNSIYSIIDITVTDYLERGFDSLMINFGCTGGQHRSVFAAESVARHLRNKFGVKIELQHLNADNWVK